ASRRAPVDGRPPMTGSMRALGRKTNQRSRTASCWPHSATVASESANRNLAPTPRVPEAALDYESTGRRSRTVHARLREVALDHDSVLRDCVHEAPVRADIMALVNRPWLLSIAKSMRTLRGGRVSSGRATMKKRVGLSAAMLALAAVLTVASATPSGA